MELNIRCKRCKQMYTFYGTIAEVSFCPECLMKEDIEYSTVREYVRDHPGCTTVSLTKELRIPITQITKYLREERLQIVGSIKNNFLLCESCSMPINTGKFCVACSKRAQTASISTAPENSGPKGVITFKS